MPWRDLASELTDEFAELTTRETAISEAFIKQRSRKSLAERERMRLNGTARALAKATSKRRAQCKHLARLSARAPIQCNNARCRVEFVPCRAGTRFCSDACAARNEAARQRAAIKADPVRLAKRQAYERIRSRKRRQRARVQHAPVTCANPRCGAVFIPVQGKRYCTPACARRYVAVKQQRRKQAAKLASHSFTCCVCAQPFAGTRIDQRCCSDACRRRLATQKVRAWLDYQYADPERHAQLRAKARARQAS